MSSMKDNDGSAKRRRLSQRIYAALCLCFIVIMTAEMTGIGGAVSRRKKLQLVVDNNEQKNSADVLKKSNGSNVRHQHQVESMKWSVQNKVMKRIIEGSVNLVDLSIDITKFRQETDGSYSGVIGHFCHIDWSLHKNNPSAYPMFRFLVNNSNDCKVPLKIDLREAALSAKEYDQSDDAVNKHGMEPKGFVFQESRCGSTLVANSLVAMDPLKNRVYSESPPPIQALKSCGEKNRLCDGKQAVELFRDVVYLMGRTDDAREENLFFKIQSIGSKNIAVAQEAFPNIPWIYVYRDPVQVMMSHLQGGKKQANCVRQLNRSSELVIDKIHSLGLNIKSLSVEEKCALHLSTLCDSAVSSLKSSQMGKAVNYKSLPHILMDSIIPDHFNIPLNSEEKDRIMKISGIYSKGKGQIRSWKEDSHQKDKAASPEVKSASNLFLSESFMELEKHQHS